MKRHYIIKTIVLTEEEFDYEALASAAAHGLASVMLAPDTSLPRHIACDTVVSTICRFHTGQVTLKAPEGALPSATLRESAKAAKRKAKEEESDDRVMSIRSNPRIHTDELDTEFYKTLLPKRR